MSRLIAHRWIAAVAIVGLFVGIPGSRVANASATKAKVKVIAIAAPALATDYGWNQQGVQAARATARAFGAKAVVDTGIGYDNTEAVLRRLATGGASFIIAHASGFNTIAPRIARQYKVPIISYDAPQNRVPGLVADIETSSQQGAYLAGVLAARTTKTGTLGIVISAADTNWYKQSGGYIAGARSVRPKVKILFAQIGPAGYEDAPGAKRVTKTVIAGGADVIFGMGDGSSFGYLQAIGTAKVGHKVWFIDVIGNKSKIDRNHVLLSSVLWNFTPTFKHAVRDINNGTFGTHNYNLNAQTGIHLLKTRYITSGVWNELTRDRALINAGKIHIPLTDKESKVKKLLGK